MSAATFVTKPVVPFGTSRISRSPTHSLENIEHSKQQLTLSEQQKQLHNQGKTEEDKTTENHENDSNKRDEKKYATHGQAAEMARDVLMDIGSVHFGGNVLTLVA